jgi:hypothetical protein
MVGHYCSCLYIVGWFVSGLIGGTPGALIESPGRYWVSKSNYAITASFNVLQFTEVLTFDVTSSCKMSHKLAVYILKAYDLVLCSIVTELA